MCRGWCGSFCVVRCYFFPFLARCLWVRNHRHPVCRWEREPEPDTGVEAVVSAADTAVVQGPAVLLAAVVQERAVGEASAVEERVLGTAVAGEQQAVAVLWVQERRRTA